MTVGQAVQDSRKLPVGAKAFVVFTTLMAWPTYLALLLLKVASPYHGFRGLSDWAYLLLFFGMFAEPAGVVVALIASFFPIGTRGKLVAWVIASGGVMAWLIAGAMLPRNVW